MEEGDSGKDVATAIVPGPAAGVNHEEVPPSNGGDVSIPVEQPAAISVHDGDGPSDGLATPALKSREA